ncbi:hypothetical protein HY389_02540 [Candidatus Daviesbacteria bacterium]|nr:hypothetical protein [Candidatus Daviesbacteria bacterium]
MITLSRDEATKLWNKFWNETKEEWFKVEILQDYTAEDNGPSLQTWLNGNKEKAIRLMLKDAGEQEWVKQAKDAPFKKIRIHIVEKSYTPYLEWEIEHYKYLNIPLGDEKVYLVDKKDVKDLDLPNGDFMVFDQKKVARNYYDNQGLAYQMDFYDQNQGDDISRFLTFRKKLLEKISTLKHL